MRPWRRLSAQPSLRHIRHPPPAFFTRINEKTRKSRTPDAGRRTRPRRVQVRLGRRPVAVRQTARGGPPGWAAPKPCPAPWGGAPGAELVPPTEDGAPSAGPRADFRAYAWYCQRTHLRHRPTANFTRPHHDSCSRTTTSQPHRNFTQPHHDFVQPRHKPPAPPQTPRSRITTSRSHTTNLAAPSQTHSRPTTRADRAPKFTRRGTASIATWSGYWGRRSQINRERKPQSPAGSATTGGISTERGGPPE